MLKNILKKATFFLLGKPVGYVISQLNLDKEAYQKIRILETMLQDAYPDEWVINERSSAEIEKIKHIFNLPETLNMSISKNDMMFRFFVMNNFTIPNAFKAYLVRSAHFIDLISRIAEHKWGGGAGTTLAKE